MWTLAHCEAKSFNLTTLYEQYFFLFLLVYEQYLLVYEQYLLFSLVYSFQCKLSLLAKKVSTHALWKNLGFSFQTFFQNYSMCT